MTTTAARRAGIVPPSPPTPRVDLVPTRASQAVLDGGWWPRSTDPITELPGLVHTLSDRYGPIRRVMLNSTAWDSRFRRLPVGPRVVRVGWFTSLDPALVVATTDSGDQLDLLVVPPHTAEAAARAAMARAADPANTMRAPEILATILAASDRVPVGDVGQDADADAARDNEGGGQLAAPPAIQPAPRPDGASAVVASGERSKRATRSRRPANSKIRNSGVEHAQAASRSDESDR